MSSPSTWVIVPIKAPAEAKRRLAGLLPDGVRHQLVLTMLEDVLGALGQVETVGPVLVVTPDAEVAEAAERRRALVLRERYACGLNVAIRAGMAEAVLNGAARALVLPADVPLATPEELGSLLAAPSVSKASGVTLVPSHDGDGTNAMLLLPPQVLEPAFGRGSFARHLAHARACGVDVQVMRLPGLGADIDEPRDLTHLVGSSERRRYEFLQAHLPGVAASTHLGSGRTREAC